MLRRQTRHNSSRVFTVYQTLYREYKLGSSFAVSFQPFRRIRTVLSRCSSVSTSSSLSLLHQLVFFYLFPHIPVPSSCCTTSYRLCFLSQSDHPLSSSVSDLLYIILSTPISNWLAVLPILPQLTGSFTVTRLSHPSPALFLLHRTYLIATIRMFLKFFPVLCYMGYCLCIV